MNDKLLFTPGPLNTSARVKSAALKDLGSRDKAFTDVISRIRNGLLQLGHVNAPDYQCIIFQGSGTYSIEAVISSAIPASGVLLNIVNGAYGRRIGQIAKKHAIPVVELLFDEDQIPDICGIENALEKHPEITHVAVVHCETTTGIINPISEIGKVAAKYNKCYIVDAMSSFGAYEIDIMEHNIHFLVSSSNKCIEGIPGFSFVIARYNELQECQGLARTLSLDLFDQWQYFESNGQFRFTPPVQVLLAFDKALKELAKEGGVQARAKRYAMNNMLLVEGMKSLGFKMYLPETVAGYIIASFLYPSDPNFSFDTFYSKLNQRGFVIYQGKLSKVDCFRIGNIGQLFPSDIKMLLIAVEEILDEMGIDMAY